MTKVELDLLEAWQAAAYEVERTRKPCADDSTAGIVEREMQLRRALVDALFPIAHEGASEVDIASAFVLKLTQQFNRKIDWQGLMHTRLPLAELGVSLDQLVEWKPALRMDVYRKLSTEARRLVDEHLTITPQAPQLEVVRKKG